LRNAQRIYSYLESAGGEKVQVVLNRFDPRKDEIEEDRIAKALGVAAKWKVPGDYQGVRRSQNLGEPLAGGNSPISRAILEMARAACGKAPVTEGKRKFSLFR
jgi:Flp pilus assembly CpaE family ATPase